MLRLKNEREVEVEFQIARRDDQALLFSVKSSENDIGLGFLVFESGIDRLEGTDENGRKLLATGLFARDVSTSSSTMMNGYAAQVEVGDYITEEPLTAEFSMLNLLFTANRRDADQHVLDLPFADLTCYLKRVEGYQVLQQILQRRGGIEHTADLCIDNVSRTGIDQVLEKVEKLCLLLSVCRSTFINWHSYRFVDSQGNSVYEHHINPQKRSFKSSALINGVSSTTDFLRDAWINYEKYLQTFDLKRLIRGYIDTFSVSFIETRSLNICVLADHIASRWAREEGKEFLIDEKEFSLALPVLKRKVEGLLKESFADLSVYKTGSMLSKVNGFNRRPMKTKLDRFMKVFNCPIDKDEVERFVTLRNSLAHSSLFPVEVDNIREYRFLRHFLDRIILSVLGHKGSYWDIENNEERQLN